LQTSLNLALGSALASIGLTIPTVAVVAPPLPPSDAAFGVDDEGFDVGVGAALPPPVEPAG
jgi:hypothetical protein